MGRVLFCAVFLTGALMADQVVLKNGDRLTGSIVKSDTKGLTLKSEFAGTVTMDWNAVETINSSEPLYLTLKSGQVLIGPVQTANGAIEVRTSDAGAVTTQKTEVVTIRSKPEEQAYEAQIERYRNPGLLDLWAGFLDFGLSMSRGNADTSTVNFGMNATRATKRDKIAVFLTSIYTSNKIAGRSILAAEAVRGGIRYDLNITDRVFGFGFTNLEYDKFQHLDLRAVVGGGIGDHLVKTDTTMFDVFGGGSLNKEFYTNLTRSSGEVLAGEEFLHKLSRVTSFQERFVLFPNVSETGEFRATFDASAVTAIRRWLSWQLTLSDRYISNPPPAIKKNDLLLTTGLRVTFAR